MSIKPTDIFINVTDLFSVILPGALVTYFLNGQFYKRFFGSNKILPEVGSEIEGWLIFLLITYIVGHIIFVLGSAFIDRLIYDKLLRKPFFVRNFDLDYHTAMLVKDTFIHTDTTLEKIRQTKMIKEEEFKKIIENPNLEIINTYKWAINYFTLNHPNVLVEIKKLEADSKFFRSLVVAFIFIGLILVIQGQFTGIFFFILSILSLYRYGDLRYKPTQKAYQLIIVKFYKKKIPV